MNTPSLRCLVTGGFGYVGSWIVRRLAESGHTVFVLSRGADTPDLGVPYTLVRADLAAQTPEELAAILPGNLDACVHMASFNEASAPGYARQALLVNAFGTRTLLEALAVAAKTAKGGAGGTPPLPLFVYFSTFHVYGRSSGAITEATPPAPAGDYALTHLFAEEYCRMFAHPSRGDLAQPCVILRLTNGFGAPSITPFGKWYLLLNDLCRQAFYEGRVLLRSNPALERDFVWLGDVAAVVERLLSRRDLAGRLFNLSSGRAVSIGEVAALAAKTASRFLGKEVPLHLEYLQAAGAAAQNPDTPPALRVDNTALATALGCAFSSPMEDEMLAIFRFLQEHGARP